MIPPGKDDFIGAWFQYRGDAGGTQKGRLRRVHFSFGADFQYYVKLHVDDFTLPKGLPSVANLNLQIRRICVISGGCGRGSTPPLGQR
jgi:hypothetical protein